MLRYIIKRVLQMIPLLIIISIISFGIIRIAEVYAGANPLALLKMNPATTTETIQREKLRLGYESTYTETIKLTSTSYTLTKGFTIFIQKPVEGTVFIKDKNNNVFTHTLPLAGEYYLEEDVLTFNKDDEASLILITYKDKNGKEHKEQFNLISTTYILEAIPLSEKDIQIKNLSTGKFFKKLTIRPQTFILKDKTVYFNEKDIGKEIEITYNTPNPWYKRYLNWAFNFIQGNMGQSYYFKTDVNKLILERLGNTLILGISTLLLTWLIAIPLGIFLAVRQYSIVDQIASAISYFFMGFPDFFLAILLLLFAATTGWFPITGMTSPGNNHMLMVEKIYNGTYEHKETISQEHKKFDEKVYELSQKQDFVNELISDLDLELSVKQPYISSTITQKLVESLPNLDNFDKKLFTEIKAVNDKGLGISIELAKKVREELKRYNYFPFSERLKYIIAHFPNLIYHYLANIPDVLYHLFLPTVTLSLISIASLQRRMRANLLDVLNEDYIRTARAKGLPENVVIYKHAVRNAINPIITLLGFEFASLLSGAAFVEIIFTWPGLGQMMLEAVLGSDLNVVMAGLMISSIMLLIGNLLADLLLAAVDPRIKLEA